MTTEEAADVAAYADPGCLQWRRENGEVPWETGEEDLPAFDPDAEAEIEEYLEFGL